jgi:hypothetical protein
LENLILEGVPVYSQSNSIVKTHPSFEARNLWATRLARKERDACSTALSPLSKYPAIDNAEGVSPISDSRN